MRIEELGIEVSQSAPKAWIKDLAIVYVGEKAYLGIRPAFYRADASNEEKGALKLYAPVRTLQEYLPAPSPNGQLSLHPLIAVVPTVYGLVPQFAYLRWTMLIPVDALPVAQHDLLASEYLKIIDPPQIERPVIQVK